MAVLQSIDHCRILFCLSQILIEFDVAKIDAIKITLSRAEDPPNFQVAMSKVELIFCSQNHIEYRRSLFDKVIFDGVNH